MSNFNEEYLKQTILQVYEGQNFSKNAIIRICGETDVGDGFMGDVIQVKITEGNRILDLVAKICVKSEEKKGKCPIEVAYNNELCFYQEVYPEFLNIQKELKVPKIFNLAPKFYTSGQTGIEAYIILENLKQAGFSMVDGHRGLDEEHYKLICETIGKFHALSFAFKRLQPHVHNKIVDKLQCIHTKFMQYEGGFLEHLMVAIQRSLSKMDKSNKMIDHYVENVLNVMKNILFESRNDKFSCVLHTDGWSNNFMFKYRNSNEKQILEDMRILDWQACRYGSPVLDLSYALYAGASRDILDNLETYLKIYYKALTSFFPVAQLRIEELYPYDVLKDQWKKYCEFGIIRALMAVKVMLHSRTQTYPTDKDSQIIFEEIIKADCCDEKLFEKVVDLFEHLENLRVF